MIAGASQADVGVLVISARRGEFETGFERGGQTREHAMLAKTLGVRALVVVINKMDDPTVNWEYARFEECVSKLKPFLKSCGYLIKKEVKFVPISALTGANLKDAVAADACDWWQKSVADEANNTGHDTLIGVLDNLKLADRDPAAPLRIPVLDRYHDRGVVAMGKVESGTLRAGQKVCIMPTKNTVKVEAIFIDAAEGGGTQVGAAKPGENVLVKLAGIGVEDVLKGFVLCDTKKPCRAVHEFVAMFSLVELLEHRPLFTSGYECMVRDAASVCSLSASLSLPIFFDC